MDKSIKLTFLIITIVVFTMGDALAGDFNNVQDTPQKTLRETNVIMSSNATSENCSSLDIAVPRSIAGNIFAEARGQECPANSGSYCPIQFPVCCLIRGDWKCAASLQD